MCKLETKNGHDKKIKYNQLTKEKVNESISHLYIEMIGDYVNSKTSTLFKCLLCGEEFTSKYERVKEWKNCGCKKCRTKTILLNKSSKSLTERTQKMFSLKSDYVEIIAYDEKCQRITCKCLLCGEVYETSYDSLILGSMHRNCASIIAMNSRRLSIEDVLRHKKYRIYPE